MTRLVLAAALVVFLCSPSHQQQVPQRRRQQRSATGVKDVTGATTVLWDRRRDEGTAPEFPGAAIHLPEYVSRVTRTTLPVSAFDGRCGGHVLHAAWDRGGDLLMGTVDDFFSRGVLAALERDALGAQGWDWAKLYADPKRGGKDFMLFGSGFPGMRKAVATENETTHLIRRCLAPHFAEVLPRFPMLPGLGAGEEAADQAPYANPLAATETNFAMMRPLVDWKFGQDWLDLQRLPHTDIKWHLGVETNGGVPPAFASVLPLTRAFNSSGTSLFAERSTGLSMLKTRAEVDAVMGAMDPHNPRKRKYPRLHVRQELPDKPGPHAPPHSLENPWVAAVATAFLRYNRYAFYDGRRLHNMYLEAEDYARIQAPDPRTGRLTVNSFFSAGPAAKKRSAAAKGPTAAEGAARGASQGSTGGAGSGSGGGGGMRGAASRSVLSARGSATPRTQARNVGDQTPPQGTPAVAAARALAQAPARMAPGRRAASSDSPRIRRAQDAAVTTDGDVEYF